MPARGLSTACTSRTTPKSRCFFETDLGYILKDLQRLFRGAKAEPVKSVQEGQRNGYQLVFAPPKDVVQRVVFVVERADLMPLRIEYADAKGTRSLRVYTDYSFPNLTPNDFKI
jgi:hypothetical protein